MLSMPSGLAIAGLVPNITRRTLLAGSALSAAAPFAPGHDAKAVVLDFVQPAGTDRRLLGRGAAGKAQTGLGLIGAQTTPKLMT